MTAQIEAKELEAKRIAATLAADVDTLAALIAPDCIYVHSTGDVETGADYLDKVLRGVYAYDSIDVDQQLALATADVLVIVFRMRAELRVGGVRRQGTSRCTAMWASEGSVHHLRAFHATPISSG